MFCGAQESGGGLAACGGLSCLECGDAARFLRAPPNPRHDPKAIPEKSFTVFDMKKGYHQMPLAKECRGVTAMVTPKGLYQWRVMPMGAKNGNAAFQRMMDWVLAEFPFRGRLCGRCNCGE